MKTPLERIRIGGFVLAAIVLAAVAGYIALGYSPLEALWMTVITVSSVGYGEKSTQGPLFQAFTILVIVFGMSAAAYTLSGFLQLITEGEIERVLGIHRMTREIERLKDHVIICGFGRMGQLLSASLYRQRQPFVVIDHDPVRVEDARKSNYLFLTGDATDDDVLISAGIQQARTLVSALPTDADNVFITLTARNLCPKLQIIARAELQRTEKKLRQAGVNKVVMPALIGAQQMSRLITRPTTADLVELVLERNSLDMELDELEVLPESKLAGTTVRDTEAHRRHRLLVVAIKQADGKMVFNPEAEYRFQAGDIVIIVGRTEDMERFRREHGVA